MKLKSTAALITALLFLQGCMTITATKSLSIKPQPDEKIVLVQADAVTQCTDYFFFFRCTLNVDVKQVK
jgi:PBP1b-binding outer membrane lipoprotein LpoB